MRAVGTLMPNGPIRKVPAPLSSSVPNTLGESKRGTHSQPTPPSGATSALVWQFDRNAYASIGRERRRRRGALGFGGRARLPVAARRHRAHWTTHGPRQLPWPATSLSASAGPQDPGA